MTDSIYNERVCPICKEWIWKWDKKCSKCYPKKKKGYEVPFMDIDIKKYGNCKCKVCKKRKKIKKKLKKGD